jgi:hypothetical protein
MEPWILISVALFMGCLLIAIAIHRLASTLKEIVGNIEPTIVIQNVSRTEDRTTSRDVIEEVVPVPSVSEMNRDLTKIQARAFDMPPIVASGNTGVEIDSDDDIKSSADRLSRNLNGV